jgi:hypothetical protein
MKKSLAVFGLLILLTFPAWKALRHPGMITGHDTESAIFKSEEFFNALKDGHFPPRWAKRLDYGLGQPTFTFTYTMPYYLTSLFMALGSEPIWAFKIVMAMSFPLAAFFSFLWLAKHFRLLPAFLAGLVYAYTPYHLANVYVRGAIGETVAAMLLPLAFWGIDRVLEKPNLSRKAFGSLIIATIILSHPFYGLIFGPVWVGYAFIRGVGWQIRKSAILAVVWGYVSCAFYIIPAWFYKSSTYLDRIEGYFLEKQPFVSLTRLIYSPWGFAGANELEKDPMSVQVGAVILVLFLAWVSVAIFHKQTRLDNNFKTSGFFAGLVAISIFMMLPISFGVWKIFTPLRALQFPWRLLFVTNLGMAFCAGFVLNRWLNKPLAFLLILLTIWLSRDYWKVGRYFPFEDKTTTAIGYPGTLTLLLEETPKWHNRNQEANPYNFGQNAKGNATLIKSLVWKTNYHKFEVVTEKEIVINDKTHYWPGWKAWVDGKETRLFDPYDEISQGLITLSVPPGKHIVETRLTEPPVNKIANSITLISLLSALFLVVLSKYEKVAKT